mmetsp:Transcript_46081/g.76151  ORF Transcript_46081/g.76151 Transcript_46081/m.76151 type:complete len:404 (+) Transcript_46081:46-1257(+)
MNRYLLLSFARTGFFAVIDGHGMLVFPPSRNAVDRFLPEFHDGQSPQTPCTCPNRGTRDASGDHGSMPCNQGGRSTAGGQPCLWWSQGCTIGCNTCTGVDIQSHGKRLCNATLEPTLPDRARTMNLGVHSGPHDTYRYHPWRAPGSAPIVDPCGQAGGTENNNRGPGDAVFTNTTIAKFGELGSKVLPYAPSGTMWLAGTTVEVGWGIRYNHGGGYQYRLCPSHLPLTESCFQRTPLAFNRSRQALLWNNGTRMTLQGVFVDEGTIPAGSTWARNPVPRIGEKSAGCMQLNASHTGEFECLSFAPPCPSDCSGASNCTQPAAHSDQNTQQGECSGDWTGGQIVDGLIIPADLQPGQYVLGWRWDCEETTQVWQACADVTICKPGVACRVPPPYTPPGRPASLE